MAAMLMAKTPSCDAGAARVVELGSAMQAVMPSNKLPGATACGWKHRHLPQNEPPLRDAQEALRHVFGAHGRRRYEPGAAAINGACALLQASDRYLDEVAAGKVPGSPEGPGAVWGWCVGSPRAFVFGFARSSGWATRKMRSALLQEAHALGVGVQAD